MLFILEGPDGTGKTTHAAKLAELIRLTGRDVLTTREPGGTAFGVEMRKWLLGDKHKIDPTAEMFGMMTDRAVHLSEVVAPALAEGKVVICDRMFESSLVYQGLVKGHGLHTIEQLNHLCYKANFKDTTPIICFVLNAPADILEARTTARGKSDDKHDRLGLEFRTRVRNGYDFIIKNSPAPYLRMEVDATPPMDQVQTTLLQLMTEALAKTSKS